MPTDFGVPLQALHADGGVSVNSLLMQLQADLIDRPVHAAKVEEIGAFGVAAMVMAIASVGVEQRALLQVDRFIPSHVPSSRIKAREGWSKAIRQVSL
jgi:glycerol kinase